MINVASERLAHRYIQFRQCYKLNETLFILLIFAIQFEKCDDSFITRCGCWDRKIVRISVAQEVNLTRKKRKDEEIQLN